GPRVFSFPKPQYGLVIYQAWIGYGTIASCTEECNSTAALLTSASAVLWSLFSMNPTIWTRVPVAKRSLPNLVWYAWLLCAAGCAGFSEPGPSSSWLQLAQPL